MRVSEVMTRDPDIARPNDTIQQVARQMAEGDYGVMPVGEGRRVTGMVTDRDITIRAVAQGLPADTPVSQVMTTGIETVREDEDMDEVHDRMSAAQVRRLPVVNQQGELVGIVALADVAREDQNKESGETLEEISEPSSFAPR